MSAQDGERAPASSPGPWALSRALANACADSELAQRCLAAALASAAVALVPEDFDALLGFAHQHLEPVLAEELGPRTAQTMIAELEAEIVTVRRSAVRPVARVALKRVPTPAAQNAPPVTESTRPPSSPTVHSPAPRDSLPASRPVVGLVDPDRWGRTTIARSLLQAGCDVLPLDGPTELLEMFTRGTDARIDVLVIDLGESGAAEAIAAMLAVLPLARVLPRGTALGAIVEVARR